MDVASLRESRNLHPGVCIVVAASVTLLVWIALSWLRKPSVQEAPAIRLLDTPAPATTLLFEQAQWCKLPSWITQDRGRFGSFPTLDKDPLFRDIADPCLLPFLPPNSAKLRRGAAIICPGGNYEFLTPSEGEPIARWVVGALSIPAFVLKYRLLPEFGLPDMLEDLAAAVRMARGFCGGGPIVAFGFSAGGHLCAAGAALLDALVLVYPALDPTEWLDSRTADFVRARVASPQVRSLAEGSGSLEALLKTKPPPTFLVASTGDSVCPPHRHSDLYSRAAREAGAEVKYVRGAFGSHGFGLQDSWSRPCAEWLQGQSFGSVVSERKSQ